MSRKTLFKITQLGNITCTVIVSFLDFYYFHTKSKYLKVLEMNILLGYTVLQILRRELVDLYIQQQRVK